MAERDPTDWDGIWRAGVTPGSRFDVSGPHTLLVEFIAAGKVPNGSALVPGCGRGYDVAALASPTRHCTGLDLSPTSIAAAQEYLDTAAADKKGQFALVAGDFFKFTGSLDFIYDLTFLCALPPVLRPDWARKMAELLKPGGILMTLQFPLRPYGQSHPKDAPPDYTRGPPYLLSSALYHELLDGAFECLEEAPVPEEKSPPLRKGAEGVALWRRKAQ